MREQISRDCGEVGLDRGETARFRGECGALLFQPVELSSLIMLFSPLLPKSQLILFLRRFTGCLTCIAVVLFASGALSADQNTTTNSSWTLVTNGAVVYKVEVYNPANGEKTKLQAVRQQNFDFDHFLPESLNNFIWTNVIARTNGRTTTLWSVRTHPPGWPAKAPIVQWDTNGLIWGMRGMTAISPCWEDEGGNGQVPITALTRRHGYTRGHGMGSDGFQKDRKGKRIWFVTRNNSVIQVTVKGMVVRVHAGVDYTIFLFNKDLPDSIEPMRVANSEEFNKKAPPRYPAPRPIFETEQTGHVSIGLPGFTLNTWKGGDSGAPNMLALANELAFLNGRSTTGPTPEMQKDMDILCRAEGLNPDKYQLQWMDLSAYSVPN